MKWSELSMTERNEVIKMAVAQGIRDIPSIKNLYEESVNRSRRFDDGGPKPVTTGGAGYIPPVNIPTKQEIRKRLYENINPYDYDNAAIRVAKAVIGNTKEETLNSGVYMPEVDDLWATYLQIPKSERHTGNRLVDEGHHLKVLPGTYKPTKGSSNGKYYKLNLSEDSKKAIVDEAMGNTYEEGFDISPNPYNNHLGVKRIEKDPINIGQNRVATSYDRTLNWALRDFTVSRGRDAKGDYVSYYDLWDISPYIISSKDQSLGIGKPFEIYDRIYLDDYYGIPKEYRGSSFLPEVVVEGRRKAEGGSIHIAPSKKGTFTAAASKHGMGVQEFASKVLSHPEDYSLTMRKKANFARNASKWKH